MNLFAPHIYRDRRNRLKRKMDSGKILLLGNDESPMNYPANHYPFRQDSTFLYFFGLNKPGLAGVIDPDKNKEVIYGKDLTMNDIVWTGAQPRLSELAAKVGVEAVEHPDRLKHDLGKSNIHYLPPYRDTNKIKIGELTGVPLHQVTDEASALLIKSITALRSVKQPEEIAELHEAVTITADMHLRAMQTAKPGLKESAIMGELLRVVSSQGSFYAFPPIVTVRGQTLHNHYHGNELADGDLLLVDCGVENLMNYAGDMTRTFPVNRFFSTQQKEIYQIVVDALKAARDFSKAGIKYSDAHRLASSVIFDGLKRLGLVRGDTATAVAEGVHALFFPHGLGHMMGLDVHDMEDFGEDHVGYDAEVVRSDTLGHRSLRLGKRLEAGNVITIEPGIYFIPELISQWKSERKFPDFINYGRLDSYLNFGGIRVENDYLIMDNKAELLGKPLPMEVEEVEEIRQSSY